MRRKSQGQQMSTTSGQGRPDLAWWPLPSRHLFSPSGSLPLSWGPQVLRGPRGSGSSMDADIMPPAFIHFQSLPLRPNSTNFPGCFMASPAKSSPFGAHQNHSKSINIHKASSLRLNVRRLVSDGLTLAATPVRCLSCFWCQDAMAAENLPRCWELWVSRAYSLSEGSKPATQEANLQHKIARTPGISTWKWCKHVQVWEC